MEIYESETEDEPCNDSVQQHLLQNFFIHPAYRDPKNVSSVNLYKILGGSRLDVSDKPKTLHPKRKDSGDFFNSGGHEVNYHKIIIEKCNKNKACSCRPYQKVIETVTSKEQNYINEPCTECPDIFNEQNKVKELSRINITVSEQKRCSKEQPFMVCANTQKNFNKPIPKNVYTTTSKECTCKVLHSANTNTTPSIHNHFQEQLYTLNMNKYTVQFESKHVQAVQSYTESRDVKNQTSEAFVMANNRVIYNNGDVDIIGDTDDNKSFYKSVYKADGYKNCKNKLNRPEGRYCVPSNFEVILASYETERECSKSNSKQSCSCQASDATSMCIQKERQAIAEKARRNKYALENISSEATSCSCERKKKCFCFRKKQVKECKANREKSIQTRKVCCSNKCYQVSQAQNRTNVPSSNYSNDTVSVCPTRPPCPKMTEKRYKRLCRSCAKNTILIPPKSLLVSDQADTLKTLIKMEAKQNYRQVNIILQELNEQKCEIKRLIQLYQGLTGSGNALDSNSAKKTYNEAENPGPHTVNICDGCGLHFYRSPNEIITENKNRDPALDKSDKMIVDGQPNDNAADINKQERTSTSKPIATPGKTQNGDTKTTKTQPNTPPHATVPENKDLNKNKPQNGGGIKSPKTPPYTKPSDVSSKNKSEDGASKTTKSPQPDDTSASEVHLKGASPNNVKIPYNNKSQNAAKTESVLTLYSKDKPSDSTTKEKDEKVEKETKSGIPNLDVSNKSSEKTSFCKSKSKAFSNWCKKSFVQIKKNDSLRQCNTYLKNKLKECQQKCRPKKSIFTCFSDYFKKKPQASNPTHP